MEPHCACLYVASLNRLGPSVSMASWDCPAALSRISASYLYSRFTYGGGYLYIGRMILRIQYCQSTLKPMLKLQTRGLIMLLAEGPDKKHVNQRCPAGDKESDYCCCYY